MNIVDRTLTVVVTATLTSAFWIIAGGTLLENADSDSQIASTRPADAAPSPAPALTQIVDIEAGESTAPVAGLDTASASQPDKSEMRDLVVPVLNVRASDLSDTFNKESVDGSSLHEALDIMAPEGTSVVAASPGTIEKLFVSKAGGKTMYVRSGDRQTIHYYAHLGEYAEGLKEGQRVRRGQRLGTVGSTGNASSEAPHLHFAILRTTKDAQWWEPANAVNPYPLFTR
ncbi:hypothetical protein GCM10023115_18950 [Pontixanthobacter gangjinensis]|uniref:Peptidoglycan DD-metalloendopeptidase family protein n=1 Tax=Pontixanthobacter gangjinensis TaxID=1028742 RepID=A0A6I4SN59_9SPHN|nr:M23 family metallopeptidase [Pontixanthobacter gangjinensis]MXO57144.1 peptidoglycan DD-metalloendopeptidase family protein [Pontixanthobacter gangjinensis]